LSSAANVPNLLNAGPVAGPEQLAVKPLMSLDTNNPPAASTPNIPGRNETSYNSAVAGERGPGSLMAAGMANPPVMTGPNDASKMPNRNVGPEIQRFPGNAGNMATNSATGTPWNNFSTGNAANSNPNMLGMPQGSRAGVPNASGPFQMGNISDSGNLFQGPGVMNEMGGNSTSGSMNTNNLPRPQGFTGRFPAPGNVGSVQGFGDMGGTAGPDNFGAMEKSGPRMSGHISNMSHSTGGGMHTLMNAEKPRGFPPGRGFPGEDNMIGMRAQGPRITFGKIGRMPLPTDRSEVDESVSSFGNSTGPRQGAPSDDAMRFGNVPGMQGGVDMQGFGRGSGNFASMTGGNMSRMPNNRPEFGAVQERMPNAGKPVRPLLDDTFFNQSPNPRQPNQMPQPLMANQAASPRPNQVPASFMSQGGGQGNPNSAAVPPPPPPPQNIGVPPLMSQTFGPRPVGPSPGGVPAPPPSQDNSNPTSSLMSHSFGPAPVGVPAPPPPQQDNKNVPPAFMSQPLGPGPVGVPAPLPSQGSVTDQQSAEQMQAAMAYYYTQWMQQQQQQQQQPQPPPPPPPPPK